MVKNKKYHITFIPAKGLYLVDSKEQHKCPGCGATLSGYDHRKRTAIGDDGYKRTYSLRRLRCPRCGQLHLELPDFLAPEKHYTALVVEAAKHGSTESCPADDSTIRRWKK